MSIRPRRGGRCAKIFPARSLRAGSLADLEAFAWPTPDDRDYSGLKRQAREYEEFALVYGFADVWQRPALVRGWEGMFLDMAAHPERVHFLCRKFTDYYLEDYTRAAEATSGRIDLYLLISDLGSQHGPLISLPMFRQFVAPYLGEMARHIHRLGGRVLYHSCGAIGPFIPDLIELGVDVLDPIQPVSPDMAPERLKANYGDRLSFHGGMDMQKLLPFGTPEQVQAEARRYCEVLGRGGGYILGPAHLFQPDVPPENVLAVYSHPPAASMIWPSAMSDIATPSTQTPPQTQSSGQPRSRRLMSLDALRGFDMFWIVGGEEVVHGLYKAWPDGPLRPPGQPDEPQGLGGRRVL